MRCTGRRPPQPVARAATVQIGLKLALGFALTVSSVYASEPPAVGMLRPVLADSALPPLRTAPIERVALRRDRIGAVVERGLVGANRGDDARAATVCQEAC